MPKWVSGKEISNEEAENSLKNLVENVCFKCETHSDQCSLAKAAADIKSMSEDN